MRNVHSSCSRTSGTLIHIKSASRTGGRKALGNKGGRKALGDITNSQICTIEHEGFMHDHNECIKARKRAEMREMNYYLKTIIGQDKSIKFGSPVVSFSKSYENDDDDLSHLKEWTVMPDSPKSRNYSKFMELSDSPKSMKFMELEEDDEYLDSEWVVESPDFKLKESPLEIAKVD